MTKEDSGKGKIALVTGGGTGVGKAITTRIARRRLYGRDFRPAQGRSR